MATSGGSPLPPGRRRGSLSKQRRWLADGSVLELHDVISLISSASILHHPRCAQRGCWIEGSSTWNSSAGIPAAPSGHECYNTRPLHRILGTEILGERCWNGSSRLYGKLASSVLRLGR